MTDNSSYHKGELAVQRRANKANEAEKISNAISNSIPDGAMRFIEQQSMVVVGSIDSRGEVWASILFGQPGFLHTINARMLELDLVHAGVSAGDPLWTNLETNTNTGFIVIDLNTRRRLRVNGRIRNTTPERYILDVHQAYSNCPRYIQRRNLRITGMHMGKHVWPVRRGTRLTANHKKLIAASDTLFVASAHPDHGVDVSHRGGNPGFIQVLKDTLIRIPDYPGNNMFNTLGNFYSYSYAGLLFIDFQHNLILQLTGKTEIMWNTEDAGGETGGTQRHWQFEIVSWQESEIPFKIDWEFLELSRFNPRLSP